MLRYFLLRRFDWPTPWPVWPLPRRRSLCISPSDRVRSALLWQVSCCDHQRGRYTAAYQTSRRTPPPCKSAERDVAGSGTNVRVLGQYPLPLGVTNRVAIHWILDIGIHLGVVQIQENSVWKCLYITTMAWLKRLGVRETNQGFRIESCALSHAVKCISLPVF